MEECHKTVALNDSQGEAIQKSRRLKQITYRHTYGTCLSKDRSSGERPRTNECGISAYHDLQVDDPSHSMGKRDKMSRRDLYERLRL